MRILVAYDGSVCGDGALYDLAAAGLPAGAEVQVLTVANPFPRFIPSLEPGGSGWDVHAPEADREAAAETLADAEGMAERACLYLASRSPGWDIRARAMLELPAQGILSQADAWKPDLIVMGSHGRSSLGRLILGSVTQKVLLHSRHPVRVCRARIGFDAYAPRLLLAMDGSPGAFAALDAMAAREWPAGTQVRMLAVVHSRASEGVRVQEAVRKLAAKGISVAPEVRMGEPRRVILHEAKVWPAHCIFLGSRGLNPFQRFLLGSVSTAVAFHAPCSVEVVRQVKPRSTGPEDKKGKAESRGPGKPAKGRRAALRISSRIRKGNATRRRPRAPG